MNKVITIDGVEYVEKAEAYKECDHICVIADRGWIFEGYREDENGYKLSNAHVVRKWTNGRGIGGLTKAEYKDEYMLDVGSVSVNPKAVIAVIPLEW